MRNVNIKGAAKRIWEYYALLYCCGRYIKAERQLKLYDNTTHKQRVLEVSVCPVCNSVKARVIQYRIEDGKFNEKKPKNAKDVSRFIKKYEKEVYYEIPELKPKFGTKSNMFWKYGVTIPVKNGYNVYSVDFNGVRQKISAPMDR